MARNAHRFSRKSWHWYRQASASIYPPIIEPDFSTTFCDWSKSRTFWIALLAPPDAQTHFEDFDKFPWAILVSARCHWVLRFSAWRRDPCAIQKGRRYHRHWSGNSRKLGPFLFRVLDISCHPIMGSELTLNDAAKESSSTQTGNLYSLSTPNWFQLDLVSSGIYQVWALKRNPYS